MTYQKVLQDERLQAIREEIGDKAKEITKDKDKKLKANDDCVEKMCKLLRKETVSEEHMEEAGMLELSQVSNELLNAFVMARNPDSKTSNLPNKGNLADAVGGVQNLIWVAHNSRTMRNYKRDQRQADIENDDVIVEPKVESLTVYDV